jgi:hypothetical protein
VTGMVITTNYKTDGIFPPAYDRLDLSSWRAAYRYSGEATLDTERFVYA